MQVKSSRLSIAHLSVRKRLATPQATSLLESLRALAASTGRNKNDQVIALITACIDAGVTAGNSIVETLARLGFNPRHVGKMLRLGCGTLPELNRWRKAPDGRYSLLAG